MFFQNLLKRNNTEPKMPQWDDPQREINSPIQMLQALFPTCDHHKHDATTLKAYAPDAEKSTRLYVGAGYEISPAKGMRSMLTPFWLDRTTQNSLLTVLRNHGAATSNVYFVPQPTFDHLWIDQATVDSMFQIVKKIGVTQFESELEQATAQLQLAQAERNAHTSRINRYRSNAASIPSK